MVAYLLPRLAVPNVLVRSVFLCSILHISPDTVLCSYTNYCEVCFTEHLHVHQETIIGLILGSKTGMRKLRTAFVWTIRQRAVVIPYRRFGTAYRSHLQGQESYFSSWILDS